MMTVVEDRNERRFGVDAENGIPQIPIPNVTKTRNRGLITRAPPATSPTTTHKANYYVTTLNKDNSNSTKHQQPPSMR
jgi:hypothetical protein